ncbi:hypothetical protein IAU59_006010 [Kwoniella sp. CBS 9459]
MPTPLSPSSSQEIIPISPPRHLSRSSADVKRVKRETAGRGACFQSTEGESPSSSSPSRSVPLRSSASTGARAVASSSSSKVKLEDDQGCKQARASTSTSSSLSLRTISARPEDSGPAPTAAQRKADPFRYRSFDTPQAKAEKRKAADEQRVELGKKSRSQVTERMLNTRGKEVNPVTNSDLYTRTDHFVSCSTGHQQSNRSGAGEGSWTYWKVRSAQMNNQARAQQTSIFSGCTIYINGSTGPKVSNLQVQHLISSNGGRLAPTQSSSCTHIIANGGLSGTKTQKWIDGQGSRGASRRAKVIKVEWVLDSVEKGVKLSEAGYGMVEDPSQPNLFKTLGVKPKLESQR